MRSIYTISIIGFVATLSNSAPIPVPADDEALFFTEREFEGQSFSLKTGLNISDIEVPVNQFSSVVLGKDIEVKLCKRRGCLYEAGSLTDGTNVSPNMADYEKQTFTVIGRKKDGEKVKLFTNDGCLFGTADVRGVGQFMGFQLGRIWNDSLRSIIVPEGLVVTLYVDDQFGGQAVTIIGPAEHCHGLPGGFPAAAMSSFIVEKYDTPPGAVPKSEGFWTHVVSGVNPKIQMAWGSWYQNGNPVSENDKKTIAASAQTNLFYQNAHISAGTAAFEAKTARDALFKADTDVCTADCSWVKGEATIVQWNISTALEPSSAVTKTCAFKCWNGGAQEQPKCPPSMCYSNFCNLCFSWQAYEESGFLQ